MNLFYTFTLVSLFSLGALGQSVDRSTFVDSALTLVDPTIVYDPSYFSIPYPNGDVPLGKGVCTDVVIRAFRKVGVDLQKEVHEDMVANFDEYPKNWRLQHTDKNIDHRRVPNLMCFFKRRGKEVAITQGGKDYKLGDIVCWNLGGGITHIGIVVKKGPQNQSLILHNIGGGQVIEDVLFSYEIIGHFRYF